MKTDEICDENDRPIGECDVSVGLLKLADPDACPPVCFCDSCRKELTPACYLHGERYHPSARFAYVSGAYPWECIYCRQGPDGKPVEDYERTVTYDKCPHIVCNLKDTTEKRDAEKWGCPKMDLDGKSGKFCHDAVRRIWLKEDTDSIFACACCRYEWLVNADHAHPLWNKCEETGHPMSFKSVREYAAERKCETLYDLLLAFDADEFRDFCKARGYKNTARRAISAIELYAQAYGWFWMGKHQAFRKGTPFEQNIRVAKTVSAVANAKARAKEAAKQTGRSK